MNLKVRNAIFALKEQVETGALMLLKLGNLSGKGSYEFKSKECYLCIERTD